MAKGVSIILYAPENKETQQKLERQLAGVYAENIIAALNKLNCAPEQKQGVLRSVMDAISTNEREKKES
ncbi:MAG: hypothetical protein KHY89_03060 [Butyricicoccus pullicaecorum]|nr:hypothetical protein [Butyricicoccus pullicaecorum]